jgi:hypothetical protein
MGAAPNIATEWRREGEARYEQGRGMRNQQTSVGEAVAKTETSLSFAHVVSHVDAVILVHGRFFERMVFEAERTTELSLRDVVDIAVAAILSACVVGFALK